jgi:hypothetical protein
MLDAIVSPDARSFELHPAWGHGEEMAAFKDPEGDCFFIWFAAQGTVVQGFAHESPMSPFRKDPPELWPGLWKGLPDSLSRAKTEPAFGGDSLTFAFWTSSQNGPWTAGPCHPPKGKDPDGAEQLLSCCFTKDFHRWAETYYGEELPPAALEALVAGNEPLLHGTVATLNPTFDAKAIHGEAKTLAWAVNLAPSGPSPKPSAARPQTIQSTRSFGGAEFIVRCERARVVMLMHGTKVVAESNVNVYEELFDLVKARLVAASKR